MNNRCLIAHQCVSDVRRRGGGWADLYSVRLMRCWECAHECAHASHHNCRVCDISRLAMAVINTLICIPAHDYTIKTHLAVVITS
jgi:hypothetical protein